MIKFVEIYHKLTGRKANSREGAIIAKSIHIDNIKNGEHIVIDGKTYVRIQLEFVDTIDENSVNLITRLKSENEFLQDKVERFIEKENYFKKAIIQLNELNKNLYHDLKSVESSTSKRNAALVEQNAMLVEKLTDLKRKYKDINEDLQSTIYKLKETVKELNLKTYNLEQELRLLVMEAKVKQSQNKNRVTYFNNARIDRKIMKMQGTLRKLEKEIELKNQEICQKAEMIDTLTRKIFEKELKIGELAKKAGVLY